VTRRPWAFPALATLGCLVGAVAAPSSWWGVGLAVAYAATMLLADRALEGSTRDGWRWGALFTVFCVTMLAGIYAFLVEPFGPDPVVALVLGALLATAIAAASMS
jgi:hypothetical protein